MKLNIESLIAGLSWTNGPWLFPENHVCEYHKLFYEYPGCRSGVHEGNKVQPVIISRT